MYIRCPLFFPPWHHTDLRHRRRAAFAVVVGLPRNPPCDGNAPFDGNATALILPVKKSFPLALGGWLSRVLRGTSNLIGWEGIKTGETRGKGITFGALFRQRLGVSHSPGERPSPPSPVPIALLRFRRCSMFAMRVFRKRNV